MTRLLPYLDQQPLYSSINFSVETYPTENWKPFPFPENQTAYVTQIAMFLCPSDSRPLDHSCSYRGNYGVGPGISTNYEWSDSGNGFYTFPGVLGTHQFPDGLSHTVAYSERIQGTGIGSSIDPARDLGNINVAIYCLSRDADYALNCCRIASTASFPAVRMAGFTWFFGDYECTAYNHAQEPNGAIPDAVSPSSFLGVVTTRSFHRGGVNSLMADGSVRFVRESIERNVCALLALEMETSL